MTAPNVLLIMTDEERYPTPYETDAVKEFRRSQLPSRDRIRDWCCGHRREGSDLPVAIRLQR